MKTNHKILYWTPRILGILTVLFIGMFAFDAFAPTNTLGQNILSFLIHLIPAAGLLILVLAAWRWELVGGIILTLAGIGWGVFLFIFNLHRTNSSGAALLVVVSLSLPFIITGILFIIHHFISRKDLQSPVINP